MNQLHFYFESLGFNSLKAEVISSKFHQSQLSKGNFLVSEGEKFQKLVFLETGQLQFFTRVDQIEEKTTYISLGTSFVTSLASYLQDIPTRENIRALKNSIIWSAEKADVVALQEEFQDFKNFYIQLIEYQLFCIDKSRLDFITLTPNQRYNQLVKENTKLMEEVPLQYLASMLGITPRHLSRLRKSGN
jgi:CRP/FNR family transcriptional regulator, anaerobic regulatory protein